MKSRVVLWSVLFLVAATAILAGATPPRTHTEPIIPYPAIGVAGGMCASGAQSYNIGWACFRIRGGETFLWGHVTDEVVEPYGGFYRFRFPDGSATPFSGYCGGSFEASIPQGATIFQITPGNVITATTCPGSGVIGEITVHFTGMND